MNGNLAILLGTALLLATGGARAQDENIGDDAETTIRLMGEAEAELPDAVTREIALPEAARVDREAVGNARRGLDTANENRSRRENGLATAAEARERAAEMADEARGNVEDRGRAEDLPDNVPGRPERPNNVPGRPELPDNVPDNPGPPQPPNG